MCSQDCMIQLSSIISTTIWSIFLDVYKFRAKTNTKAMILTNQGMPRLTPTSFNCNDSPVETTRTTVRPLDNLIHF